MNIVLLVGIAGAAWLLVEFISVFTDHEISAGLNVMAVVSAVCIASYFLFH